MPSNLTGSKINETYSQLLHIDGGPAATEKAVLSGTGVSTALSLGINSASVGNIRLSGNSISALSGNVEIANAAISGGSITGIVDLPIEDGGTGASTAVGARTNLGLGTMATQNANAVAITGGTISGVTIPLSSISDLKYGEFYSTQDQTASANTPTAITLNTSASFNSGITVVSNSRITFATAGIYELTTSIQFINADSSTEYDATVWFRKNNTTDIEASASKVTVPKNSVGGALLFQVTIMESISASDFLEVFYAVENSSVSLKTAVAQSSPFICPAIPSVIVTAKRIA